MITVVAKNHIDIKHKEEVLNIYRELVDNSRKEKGCTSYGVYIDTDHPELLTMIEEWNSYEELTDHLSSDFFKEKISQLRTMITQDADMNVYQQVI
jgi:quinol monooxygenase YgiN